MDQAAFLTDILKGYSFQGDSILMGAAVLEGVPIKETFVRIPLSTLNRHGLIAGATGTGKTKTLGKLHSRPFPRDAGCNLPNTRVPGLEPELTHLFRTFPYNELRWN